LKVPLFGVLAECGLRSASGSFGRLLGQLEKFRVHPEADVFGLNGNPAVPLGLRSRHTVCQACKTDSYSHGDGDQARRSQPGATSWWRIVRVDHCRPSSIRGSVIGPAGGNIPSDSLSGRCSKSLLDLPVARTLVRALPRDNVAQDDRRARHQLAPDASSAESASPGDEGPRIALRYNALIRVWGTLVELLRKRLGFRNVARYWEKHGEDPAILLSGAPLVEAEGYHDRNRLEDRFLGRCREAERAEAERREQAHQEELGRVQRLAKTQASEKRWLAFAVLFLSLSVAFAAALIYQASQVIRYEREEMQRQAEEARLAEQLSELNNAKAAFAEKQRADAEKAANTQVARINQVTNVLLLSRDLASMTTAASSTEWNVGVIRLRALQSRLKLDSFFSPFDNLLRQVTESTPKEYGPDSQANLLALDIIHKLRDHLLTQGDSLAEPLLKSLRDVAFRKIELVADGTTEQLSQRPFIESEAYRREFWDLYWGELAMYEGDDVESAMVGFGRSLRAIQDDLSQTSKEQLAAVEERFKSLKKEDVARLTRALLAQNTAPEEFRGLVRTPASRRPSKAQLDELRARRAELRNALQRERALDILPRGPSPGQRGREPGCAEDETMTPRAPDFDPARGAA
jgi:hypothetical protein